MQVQPLIANQNPEQLVRDQIDKMLLASGWQLQSEKQINLTAVVDVAVRENETNIGFTDYILFARCTFQNTVFMDG